MLLRPLEGTWMTSLRQRRSSGICRSGRAHWSWTAWTTLPRKLLGHFLVSICEDAEKVTHPRLTAETMRVQFFLSSFTFPERLYVVQNGVVEFQGSVAIDGDWTAGLEEWLVDYAAKEKKN